MVRQSGAPKSPKLEAAQVVGSTWQKGSSTRGRPRPSSISGLVLPDIGLVLPDIGPLRRPYLGLQSEQNEVIDWRL